MGRLVAIGDIHGCSLTLEAMLDRLELVSGETLLVTGDLSGKGPDSQGVHHQLVDLERRGVELILLIGNHDLMLLAVQRFLGAAVDLSHLPKEMLFEAEMSFFIRGNGGWATLRSYGFDRVDERSMWAFDGEDARQHFSRVAESLTQTDWFLPPEHLDLLSKCQTHHIDRNCLFVHAGLELQFLQFDSAESAVGEQIRSNAAALAWSRDWLGAKPAFPELLVHGHTPLSCLFSYVDCTKPWQDDRLTFKAVVHEGALNLDSGAFLESGHLTAVEIPHDGNPSEMTFLRVPRVDPIQKDPLWYVNFTS